MTSIERIGMAKGIEQGIEKGKQEGLQEGRQEGLKEGIKKSVLRLRDKLRLDAEQISDVLDVPLDTVRRYLEASEQQAAK